MGPAFKGRSSWNRKGLCRLAPRFANPTVRPWHSAWEPGLATAVRGANQQQKGKMQWLLFFFFFSRPWRSAWVLGLATFLSQVGGDFLRPWRSSWVLGLATNLSKVGGDFSSPSFVRPWRSAWALGLTTNLSKVGGYFFPFFVRPWRSAWALGLATILLKGGGYFFFPLFFFFFSEKTLELFVRAGASHGRSPDQRSRPGYSWKTLALCVSAGAGCHPLKGWWSFFLVGIGKTRRQFSLAQKS